MRCHVVAGALLVAAVAGCWGGDRVDVPVERAEPVYWLGDSFEGLPLTHAEVGEGRAFLVYGDCEPPPGSDAGCSPPLQLQEAYPPAGDLERDVTCPAPGGPGRGDDPHSIVVFAGPTTITIYADAQLAERAAAALRPAPGACGPSSN